MFLPTFATYIARRTSGSEKFIRSMGLTMQATGALVRSTSGRMARSRNKTRVRSDVRDVHREADVREREVHQVDGIDDAGNGRLGAVDKRQDGPFPQQDESQI